MAEDLLNLVRSSLHQVDECAQGLWAELDVLAQRFSHEPRSSGDGATPPVFTFSYKSQGMESVKISLLRDGRAVASAWIRFEVGNGHVVIDEQCRVVHSYDFSELLKNVSEWLVMQLDKQQSGLPSSKTELGLGVYDPREDDSPRVGYQVSCPWCACIHTGSFDPVDGLVAKKCDCGSVLFAAGVNKNLKR